MNTRMLPVDRQTRRLDSEALFTAWCDLLDAHPTLRILDAANSLSVSEAELLALQCNRNVTRLSAVDWPALLLQLPGLGEVMALTRNEHAVHEKHGNYANIEIGTATTLVLNGAIDLRLFLHRWHYAYAVTDQTAAGERHSLQFFDRYGCAVHKVFLTAKSRLDAYTGLVEQFTDCNQRPGEQVEIKEPLVAEQSSLSVDVDRLRSAWAALRDTHDFVPMLKSLKIRRLQALRLVGHEFAESIATASVERLLQCLAGEAIPLMAFVSNAGTVQIHTGAITNVTRTGAWLNILDREFNLHVRDTRVASTWLVRKPTVDGIVTSVELYDEQGGLVVQFFGKRKPGEPESLLWRAMVSALVD